MSRIGLTSSGQAPLKEHLSASGIISHHPRAQDAGTVRVGLEYRNQLFENGHLSLAKAGCWFVSRGIALGGVVIDWVSATVWLEGTVRTHRTALYDGALDCFENYITGSQISEGVAIRKIAQAERLVAHLGQHSCLIGRSEEHT